MKFIIKAFVLGAVFSVLSGCNTLKGIQKDFASVTGTVKKGVNNKYEDNKNSENRSNTYKSQAVNDKNVVDSKDAKSNDSRIKAKEDKNSKKSFSIMDIFNSGRDPRELHF